MIALSLLLVPLSLALLIVGLAREGVGWVWGSLGVSALAAVALALGVRRRHSVEALPAATEPTVGGPVTPAATGASGAAETAVEPEPAGGSGALDRRDDEVLVVDGHPRYHRAGCPVLEHAPGGPGRDDPAAAAPAPGPEPLPVREAREAGFTPCAQCRPMAHLLRRDAPDEAGAGSADGTSEGSSEGSSEGRPAP